MTRVDPIFFFKMKGRNGAGGGRSSKRAKITHKRASTDAADLEPGRHAGHVRPSRQGFYEYVLCVKRWLATRDASDYTEGQGALVTRGILQTIQELLFDRAVVSCGIPEDGSDFSPGGMIDYLRKDAGGMDLVEGGF